MMRLDDFRILTTEQKSTEILQTLPRLVPLGEDFSQVSTSERKSMSYDGPDIRMPE